MAPPCRFAFSTGVIGPTAQLGLLGACIALLPLSLLPRPGDKTAPSLSEPMLSVEEASAAKRWAAKAAPTSAATHGVPFPIALSGPDFWLLFFMQLAVFGGGVAANQNLALIFESARSPAASGLGVALFALASTVSRVSVGVLSDQYAQHLSRFDWLVAVCATATVGQLLLSPMVAGYILTGTFCLGLSFGSFFTLVVPVVNEMYGRRDFGFIMGASLGSQAIASFAISVELLPAVYRLASHGLGVCYGADCFLDSFLSLAGLNAVGFAAAIWLARRNRSSQPVDRYYASS